MKNLKKAGAVALAAVMAVAFAPVASLPVNAAAYTPAGYNLGAPGATTIDSTFVGTHGRKLYLSDDPTGIITVKTDCSIDLNGNTIPASGLVVQNGATLTVTDGSVKYNSDGSVATDTSGKANDVILGTVGTNNSKDDTEAGNVIVGKGAKIDNIKIIKGSVDVKDGTVGDISTDAVANGADAKDKEGLVGASSILVEGGTVTFGTLANPANALLGKEALKATSGVTIKGGSITMGASFTENAANVNGDFVTIQGGKFAATNFAQFAVTGWTKKFLNTTSEWALPIGVDNTTATEYYIGDDAIAAEVNAGKDVLIVNGDAAISGIEANGGTVVNEVTVTDPTKTLKGTLPTVTATAAKDTSLLCEYTQAVDNNTRLPDTRKYFFGASKIKSEIEGATLNTNANAEYLVSLDVDYQSDFNGVDGKAGTDDDILFDFTTKKELATKPSGKPYVSDVTYFTTDPSAHVDEENEVGVIDDKYYIVSTSTGKTNAYKNATSSVKILRTKGWEAETKDTTENQKAVSTFDVRKDVATSVTGPEDNSVIVYNPTVKTVSLGGENKYLATATAYVFGKSANVAKNAAGAGLDEYTNDSSNGIQGVNVTGAELVVQNIIPDVLDIVAIDKDVTINAAEGLDWYSNKLATPVVHDEYTYHFAKTEKANEAFKNALYGYTTDKGVKIAKTIGATDDSGETRVSQGISGTYEDLGTGIKIDAEWAGGEQSSTLKADKSARTWYVNLENKNLPRQVYRLRAKVGNNHLFTMDKDEADNAVASGDWVLENTNSFKMLPWNTDVKGAVKVLRFRNVRTNEFLYTTDPTEQANLFASADWAEGNVAFCGVSTETGYPVTRLNSLIGQGHLYSTAKAEVANAVKNDFFQQEGTAFWAVETPEKEK